jgi:hypothetical protein
VQAMAAVDMMNSSIKLHWPLEVSIMDSIMEVSENKRERLQGKLQDNHRQDPRFDKRYLKAQETHSHCPLFHALGDLWRCLSSLHGCFRPIDC